MATAKSVTVPQKSTLREAVGAAQSCVSSLCAGLFAQCAACVLNALASMCLRAYVFMCAFAFVRMCVSFLDVVLGSAGTNLTTQSQVKSSFPGTASSQSQRRTKCIAEQEIIREIISIVYYIIFA